MEKPEISELEKTRLDIFKTIAQCNSDMVKKLENINSANLYLTPNSSLTVTGDFNMGYPITSAADTANSTITFSNITPNPNPPTIVLPKTKPVKTKKRKK